MTIVVCGNMSASKEMVAVEAQLLHEGHEVILSMHAHEYAAMEVLNSIITESAREKIEEDLSLASDSRCELYG